MSNFENELRAALANRSPSEDEKTVWAERAASAPTTCGRVLPGPWAWVAAAGLLLAVGTVLWARTDGDVSASAVVQAGEGGDAEDDPEKDDLHPEHPEKAGFPKKPAKGKREESNKYKLRPLDEQRAIHDRFLANKKFAKSVWEAKPGTYIMLAGLGEDVNLWTGRDPKEMMRLFSRSWPDAAHRYFFRAGPNTFPPTTLITQASPVRVGVGGMMFLEEIGLKISKREDGSTRFDLGDLKTAVATPHLELVVGRKRVRHRFEIVPTAQAPLVVPDELCHHQFEIPGTIILTTEHGVWLKCRRYFLRVRHAGLGLDRFVECAGRPEAVALDLHGHMWHKLERPDVEEAKDAPLGRELLVLEAPVEKAALVRAAFASFRPSKSDGPFDKVRHSWRLGPNVVLTRYTTDGRAVAKIGFKPGAVLTKRTLSEFLSATPKRWIELSGR